MDDNKPTERHNDDNDNYSDADEQDDREHWSSRLSFWLGAVGSAVGLGNLWRFPYQCASWGGGAFIFAYLVALITIGMPLLTQELALGQKHRSGDIEAFGKMNWRLRGIGLASIIGTFGIVTYYMMIIGISGVFFFESFSNPLPYNDPEYYEKSVLLYVDSIDKSKGIMSGKLFLATALCWVITFICVHKGVKTASIAVKITMPLPFLLLIILLIKGLTLDGATNGIKRYLDFTDWSALGSSGIWNAAIGQCFFSLSVCMGVMTAFGSYNPIKQDIATDEKVIALMDVSASLISGFVVYSILGYLVFTTGNEDWYDEASLGLVFAAYPVAITTFKGANFFGIIFYLCLVLLGIDSAFSMVEALSTVIFDSDLNKYKLKLTRAKITAAMCVFGFFGSCLFTFDSGLHWLDIIDRYINNYGMVFIGICEVIACGWFYGYKELVNPKIGYKSANIYRCGFFIAILVMGLEGILLQSVFDKWYIAWAIGISNGFIIWISSIIISYCFNKNVSLKDFIWYNIGWENVEILRDYINGNGIGDDKWSVKKHTFLGEISAVFHHGTIGIYWGFYIKYFIPIVLIINLIGTMREDTINPYGDYDWKYLSVGIIIFSLMVIVVIVVAVFPTLMAQECDNNQKQNKNINDSKFSAVEQRIDDDIPSIDDGIIEQQWNVEMGALNQSD